MAEEEEKDPRMKLLRQGVMPGGVFKTPQGEDVALDLIISFRFLARQTPTPALLKMGEILTEELNKRTADSMTRQRQGVTFGGA